MKVYSYKCETCGKESQKPDGWRTLKTDCSGGPGSFQEAISSGYRSHSTRLVIHFTGGGSSRDTMSEVDFCSPECAGAWVFR